MDSIIFSLQSQIRVMQEKIEALEIRAEMLEGDGE